MFLLRVFIGQELLIWFYIGHWGSGPCSVYVNCGFKKNKRKNNVCFSSVAGFAAGRIIMALAAKFFVFISFDAVYVYSAELFPTVVRLDTFPFWFAHFLSAL